MKKPEIRKENAELLLDKRFIRVFDLQYAEGKHYFDATRRTKENLVAVKSEAEFQQMLPDAVTCLVVLQVPGEPDRLLLSYEYRYPAGQFLLGPPAGLIDERDLSETSPVLSAAKREIFEETGIEIKDTDRLFIVNEFLFSTPGMTDEANAIAGAVVTLPDLSQLTQEHAEGGECFDGFRLLTKEEAEVILKNGRDDYGHFYSAFTWCVLRSFVDGLWKGERG